MEAVTDFIFLGSKITGIETSAMKLKKHLLLGRKAMTNLDSILKRHYFYNRGLYSQSYGFSRSHIQMWELDRKVVWVPKNWHFWTVVLEKTLGSPLDCKETQPGHSKGNQSRIFIGRMMLKLKVQYFDHLIWSMKSLDEILMPGKIEGRRRGQQRIIWLDGIIDSVDISVSKILEMVKNWETWHAAIHVAAKSRTQLSD